MTIVYKTDGTRLEVKDTQGSDVFKGALRLYGDNNNLTRVAATFAKGEWSYVIEEEHEE